MKSSIFFCLTRPKSIIKMMKFAKGMGQLTVNELLAFY